jgi:hypothetical protein
VQAGRELGADGEGAHPLGTEQPLLGRDRIRVRARRREVDKDRADALRAVDGHEGVPGVGDLGEGRDRQHRAGHPCHMRGDDEPRPWRHRGLDRRQSSYRRRRHRCRRSRCRRRARGARRAGRSRPRARDMSSGRGRRVATRSPRRTRSCRRSSSGSVRPRPGRW